MALSDYQLQIGDLVLGGEGNDYIVHNVEGLGTPDWRVSDVVRPQDHGYFYGSDYLEARTVTVALTIRGDSPAEVASNIDALKAEWYLDTRTDSQAVKELMFKLPGQSERQLAGRPRRLEVDTSRLIGQRARAVAMYHAADPRQYSSALHEATLSLATASTGRAYDKSFDYGYGGGSGGVTQVDNAGNLLAPVTVRFAGPVTNPFLENTTTGETLTLTITIATGDYIEVDFADRTVLLNGTASRYYAKSGTFWELAPGANDIRFGASGYDAAASATVTWRDAWL